MNNIGPYTFESWIPFLVRNNKNNNWSASMRYYVSRVMENVHGIWKSPAQPRGLMPMEKYLDGCEGILGHLTLADGPIEWHPTIRICEPPSWFQPILEVKPGEVFTYSVLRLKRGEDRSKWTRMTLSDSIQIVHYGWVGSVPEEFFLKHQDPGSVVFRVGFVSQELDG